MSILELKNLSKQFGGVKAVENLSLNFSAGQITALIGPNGAGKTTVFNLIGGLIRPDSGSISFERKNLVGLTPWQIADRGIGRLFQDVRLFRKMTVLENVLTAYKFQQGESIWRALFAPWTEIKPEKERRKHALDLLEKVGLAEKAESPSEKLSYGQQKLLAIARLLAADAKVLLLDEPTAGVNRVMIEEILKTIQLLAQEGKTIVFVEHNMEVVRSLAQTVIFMSTGRATASGTPDEVLSSSEVKTAYIGRVKC